MNDPKTIRANLRWAGLRFEDPKTLDLSKLSDDIDEMRKAMKRVANYLEMDNPDYREFLGVAECKANDEMRSKLLEALKL